MTPRPRLTPRQHECMRGLLAHKRTKVIAEELGLSPKTVYSYIAEAAALLNARDQADAAAKYLELFGPGEIPGETDRVGSPRSEEATPVPQPANVIPVGRGMERYSKLQRMGLIVAMSLAISLGLGLCAVAVVGMIAIYDDVPRPTIKRGR